METIIFSLIGGWSIGHQYIEHLSKTEPCAKFCQKTRPWFHNLSFWPKAALSPLNMLFRVYHVSLQIREKNALILYQKQNAIAFTTQYNFIEHRNHVYRRNIHSLNWDTRWHNGMAARQRHLKSLRKQLFGKLSNGGMYCI